MKTIKYVLLALILGLTACENPFGEDEISGAKRELRGTVKLQNGMPAHGVYVWLQGVDIGVFSDENGGYALTIPPKAALSSSGISSGTFDLYFYSINFKLVTRKIVLNDGELVYDEADLSRNGTVSPAVYLIKDFRARTSILPTEFDPQDGTQISITAYFFAEEDSTEIILPDGSLSLLGGVFFKHVETNEVYMSALGTNKPNPTVVKLKDMEAMWSFHPNMKTLDLPVGIYQVIPYVFGYHPSVPRELFTSMNITPYIQSENYADIYFDCQCAEIRVRKGS